ncbi:MULTISPECIES: I78 family peptidase inhibitor [Pseudomonas]|uniref:I78 family peptidase inhibitor n=1 Tax=Pseudomonas TaxID=286 RepID=UPI000DA6AC7D|nr:MULTISPECIES: I78 family peptidase inhibitor [Pseudomonas]MCU1720203.1 I78 family peptidase inhibitor [Pseudomonas sp. 5P_5.1_Bac1]MCU1734210.1 I78 family peptidase inhibitor [Pseudomonas sp. 20P_3.2_Bac4]MCU1743142.1 I78 family peptidase inhibitor [Pseudomonas sp. 20P_3.2_Bac5]
MFPMRASLVSLLAAVILVGCSSGGTASKAPEVAAAPNLDGRCEASGAAFAVGKPASAELLEQARKASGAQLARVLKPDDAVTLEYRSERLNLHADEKGVIARVNCG